MVATFSSQVWVVHDRKETSRGFKIAVVAANPHFFQFERLVPGEKTHGRTEGKTGFPVQSSIDRSEFLQMSFRYRSPGSYQGKTLYAVRFIFPGELYGVGDIHDIIGGNFDTIMARLGTKFTILTALSGFGIDNGTQIETVFMQFLPQLVGNLIQLSRISRLGQFESLDKLQLLPMIFDRLLFFNTTDSTQL